jgi:hypothetical protein
VENKKQLHMITRIIKKGFTTAVLCFSLIFSADCYAQKPSTKSNTKARTTKGKTQTPPPPPAPAPESPMRKLWLENAMWTRMYLVNFGGEDKAAILTRLRKNVNEIALESKKTQPGIDDKRFASLLDSAVIGVTSLIFQANLGQGTEAYQAKENLMKQTNQLADFLNKANPNAFPLAETKVLFQGYLNETHNQIMSRASKSWEADIGAFDRVNDFAVRIADATTKGIMVNPPPPPPAAPASPGKG